MIKFEYEQYKPTRQIWTWLTVFFLAAMTIGWGLLGHALVREGSRHWDYGTLPDTPGQSVFSTLPPPEEEAVPPQIQLPPDLAAETVQKPADE